MDDRTEKNIRISLVEKGAHIGHTLQTLVIDAEKSIKSLYCVNCNKNIVYLFARNKEWTLEKAQVWIDLYTSSLINISLLDSTNMMSSSKYIGITKQDGNTWQFYDVQTDPFVLNDDIEDYTLGLCRENEDEKEYDEDELNIIKLDEYKRIVYGVFLVPDKADHHGDVISKQDVEMVAHKFLVEYRIVDEMHKTVIAADVIESAVAWRDGLKYYGKSLSKGTWFGAIKINDARVWEKVVTGKYKAFSVRISGVRKPINQSKENG